MLLRTVLNGVGMRRVSMFRFSIYFASVLFALTLCTFAAMRAHAGVAQGAVSLQFVKLQATTPGTPQSGHVNVTGTVLAGKMAAGVAADPNYTVSVGGTNGLSVNATSGYGVSATTTGATSPGVYGTNQVKQSQGYLGCGTDGVVGVNGTGGYGGRFVGNVIASGNLGLHGGGTAFPLTMSNDLGDKISLYGQFGSHYGFGVQPSLLQIHSDLPVSDIAFGSDSSGAFVETMRVKGNGFVGIGTSVPSYGKLEVKQSSSSSATPAIYAGSVSTADYAYAIKAELSPNANGAYSAGVFAAAQGGTFSTF